MAAGNSTARAAEFEPAASRTLGGNSYGNEQIHNPTQDLERNHDRPDRGTSDQQPGHGRIEPGRRLQDDVTDIELLAVAGAAYSVLTADTFNFNPALVGVLRDNIDMNDKQFRYSFPYLATPHQGQVWFAGGGPNQSVTKPLSQKAGE